MDDKTNNRQAIINAGLRMRGFMLDTIKVASADTGGVPENIDKIIEDSFTLGMNALIDLNRIADAIEAFEIKKVGEIMVAGNRKNFASEKIELEFALRARVIGYANLTTAEIMAETEDNVPKAEEIINDLRELSKLVLCD